MKPKVGISLERGKSRAAWAHLARGMSERAGRSTDS
jgi:hypothetical protein